MISTRLPPVRTLLLPLLAILTIGVQPQGTTTPSSCTETITARSGDTCASLADRAEISVTDFLRSNPSVTSCSVLIAGAVYCTLGTAVGPPAVPAASSLPPSGGDPTISGDGTCGGEGGGVTCAGSRFGRCCSAHGYCGSSADYCGEGCLVGFGECGSGGDNAEATSRTVQGATTTTAAAITSVVVVTRTRTVTDTLTARGSTSILTLTLTSVFPSTAVVTSTSVVRATSVRRATSTSTTLVTAVVTAISTRRRGGGGGGGGGGGRSTRRGRPSTTTTTMTQKPKPTPAPAKPSPALPDTPRSCKTFDRIRDGDDCRSVARRNGISLRDLYVYIYLLTYLPTYLPTLHTASYLGPCPGGLHG